MLVFQQIVNEIFFIFLKNKSYPTPSGEGEDLWL